jgi:isopenicillin-N N-acyltransferase-like protein
VTAAVATSFPIIELTGDPKKRGITHGRALAGEIKTNVDLYLYMAANLAQVDKDRAFEAADKYQPTLKTHAPRLLAEMEGIAQGAGVTLTEILFLNARTEILALGAPAGECTVIGLNSSRTANGHTIIAQSWDWHHSLTQTSALFYIKPDNGPTMLILAEAGQVGKIGLNEHGVGVVLNILVAGTVEFGIPVHVMLRQIVECQSAKQARDMVMQTPKASASHFLIGDSSGDLYGLELTGQGAAEIKPDNGLLFHTNHYCHPDMTAGDIGKLLFLDSVPRYDRAAKLLAEKTKLGVEDLTIIYTNHEDGPSSICRHIDESMPDYLHMTTISNVIMDLDTKTMLTTRGQPCQSEYFEFKL